MLDLCHELLLNAVTNARDRDVSDDFGVDVRLGTDLPESAESLGEQQGEVHELRDGPKAEEADPTVVVAAVHPGDDRLAD